MTGSARCRDLITVLNRTGAALVTPSTMPAIVDGPFRRSSFRRRSGGKQRIVRGPAFGRARLARSRRPRCVPTARIGSRVRADSRLYRRPRSECSARYSTTRTARVQPVARSSRASGPFGRSSPSCTQRSATPGRSVRSSSASALRHRETRGRLDCPRRIRSSRRARPPAVRNWTGKQCTSVSSPSFRIRRRAGS